MADESNLSKSALLAIILFALAILAWEVFLRKDGSDNAYDDSPALFAHSRGQIYGPKENTTVFIGSSRIKFDLHQQTWREITGDNPVQLACVGSTPLPVLDDLAKDEKFAGKLVVDVTEVLFLTSTLATQSVQIAGLNIIMI